MVDRVLTADASEDENVPTSKSDPLEAFKDVACASVENGASITSGECKSEKEE